MRNLLTPVVVLAALAIGPVASAADADETRITVPWLGRVADLPFWTDVAFHGPLRLQENARSGRRRILARVTKGERGPFTAPLAIGGEEIAGRFETLKAEYPGPFRAKAIVFVHGLGRAPGIWSAFKRAAEAEGYATYEFDYASGSLSIGEIAARLGRAVASLDGPEELHFVVHSMGGIVVRAWSAAYDDARLGRTVMLGTPNKGSAVAARLKDWPPFAVTGPAGKELADLENGPGATLPPPDGEFAIVAGSLPTTEGINPFAPGDDDGIVAVASTPLAGAADYLIVPHVLHHRLVDDERVIAATLRFLETGRLRAEGPATPIAAE